jgi:hypothetical protein
MVKYMKILRKLFSKKPKSEKIVLDKIKTLKKEKPNNGNYHNLGGNWISKEAGSYHITYRQKGKIISLFDLRKTEKRKEINPKEYRDLLEKSIKNSRNLGCEMIVIKTWIFAKYPELKEFGFLEIKPGSEAKFSEFISKRKITEEKLLSNPENSRYPLYYLKI